MRLTVEASARTLGEIVLLSLELGYPPTVKELADRLGLSTGAVYVRLVRLRDAGYVSWQPRQARTLRVLGLGWDDRGNVYEVRAV